MKQWRVGVLFIKEQEQERDREKRRDSEEGNSDGGRERKVSAEAVTDFLRINRKFQLFLKGLLLILVVAAELLPLFSVTRKKRKYSHLPILLEHVLTCAQGLGLAEEVSSHGMANQILTLMRDMFTFRV
ncbi:hypothetical protein JHK85_043987 [Glycine max]|nr:hypothetical protein JHK85_043987 [Glycine max]